MKEKNDITLSSASDVQKYFDKVNSGILVKLPASGLTVKTKVPDVLGLVVKEKLPKNLISMAMKLKTDGKSQKNLLDKMELDEVKDLIEFLNNFFQLAIIDPTFTDEQVEQISIDDKFVIFNLISMGTKSLESFRKQQLSD